MKRLLALDRRWLGLIAAGLVVFVAIFDERAALRGLLAGFLLLVAVPAGAMLLLLVHGCTGGRWGELVRPQLRSGAAALPGIAVMMLPVLFLPFLVYPWAADTSLVRHPDVAALYFNVSSFALRSLAALGIWCFIAVRAARLSRPLAGLGLALFGLTVSFAAVDWVIALDPKFKSTAFAMSLSVAFLLSGAGFTVATGTPGEARDDIAKLIATFALGLLYLDLMQFIVAYAGNLPDIAAWYLRRWTWAGSFAIGFSFLAAALVPFVAVMRKDWRRSAPIQRFVGVAAVLGVAVRTLWWTVPELGSPPLFWLSLAFSLAAAAGLVDALRRRRSTLPLRFRRRLSHGG